MDIVVSSRPSRCAFCHDHLSQGRTCEHCGTSLHAACWREAGHCPTIGCHDYRPARRQRVEASRPRTRRPGLASLVIFAGLVVLAVSAINTFRGTLSGAIGPSGSSINEGPYSYEPSSGYGDDRASSAPTPSLALESLIKDSGLSVGSAPSVVRSALGLGSEFRDLGSGVGFCGQGVVAHFVGGGLETIQFDLRPDATGGPYRGATPWAGVSAELTPSKAIALFGWPARFVHDAGGFPKELIYLVDRAEVRFEFEPDRDFRLTRVFMRRR